MSAAPSQAAQFESDREQLIEGQPFNHDEELVMQNNLRNKMEQSQRRHLIGIAVVRSSTLKLKVKLETDIIFESPLLCLYMKIRRCLR